MKRISAGVLAAALLLVPSAGEAAKSKRGKACPDEAVCVWTKSDFRGEREVVSKKGATNLSKELNNKVSSVKNRTGRVVYLMDAKNGSSNDDYQCMSEESEFSELGNIGFNNRISSVLRLRPGDPKLVC